MKLITVIDPGVDIPELTIFCDDTDAILLRQDAAWLSARTDIIWPVTRVYVLHSDVYLRKITVSHNITSITDLEWVNLTIEAEQNLLW